MSAVRATRWIGALMAAAVLVLVSAPLSPSASLAPAQSPPEPQGVSFSVAGGDPLTAQGVHPADILGAGGIPAILCADLGLMCADPVSGASDEIRGLSFGQDFQPTGLLPIHFSVDQGAQGAAGTAVRAEANCNPTEPQADVFGTEADGANVQVFDGDGAACGGNAGLSLYLTEGISSTNVYALDGDTCLSVDLSCDGVPDSPIFFTLAPGSPTLTATAATSADILITNIEYTPVKWADGVADLGLVAGDAIDALCVREDGSGAYDGEDQIAFSLAPGSPTLSSLSASPADLLLPGQPPVVFYAAASLGLLTTDNVDAAMCSLEIAQVAPAGVVISGPPTGVIDAAYVFTATVSPISTTLPITYVWQATGQSAVTRTGNLSNSVAFTWTMSGAQAITVTVANDAGMVADTHVIQIDLRKLYLPVVLRNFGT